MNEYEQVQASVEANRDIIAREMFLQAVRASTKVVPMASLGGQRVKIRELTRAQIEGIRKANTHKVNGEDEVDDHGFNIGLMAKSLLEPELTQDEIAQLWDADGKAGFWNEFSEQVLKLNLMGKYGELSAQDAFRDEQQPTA